MNIGKVRSSDCLSYLQNQSFAVRDAVALSRGTDVVPRGFREL